MPLGSVEYEDKTFRACYGSQHSAAWPASFTVHLFADNPRDGGAELPAEGGYAPPTIANDDTNFPAPTGGEQEVSLVTITATGPWSVTAYYAGLKDPAGVLVEYVELAAPLEVLAAGDVNIPLNFWHDDLGA